MNYFDIAFLTLLAWGTWKLVRHWERQAEKEKEKPVLDEHEEKLSA